jgi:hypothetical protein
MSIPAEAMKRKIERIKKDLMELGPMRPGSISRQYRRPKQKERPFYQISYTHRMRSHSEYVRPENLETLRQEVANFKKFRKLIDRWVDLALKASQTRVKKG